MFKLNTAPREVQTAFAHVAEFIPQITAVSYDEEGRWIYLYRDGTAPSFKHYSIDTAILEAASDSVYGLLTPIEYEV